MVRNRRNRHSVQSHKIHSLIVRSCKYPSNIRVTFTAVNINVRVFLFFPIKCLIHSNFPTTIKTFRHKNLYSTQLIEWNEPRKNWIRNFESHHSHHCEFSQKKKWNAFPKWMEQLKKEHVGIKLKMDLQFAM